MDGAFSGRAWFSRPRLPQWEVGIARAMGISPDCQWAGAGEVGGRGGAFAESLFSVERNRDPSDGPRASPSVHGFDGRQSGLGGIDQAALTTAFRPRAAAATSQVLAVT